MSNPARAPVELTAAQLSLGVAPDAYFLDFSKVLEKAKALKNLDAASSVLNKLDMERCPAIEIPKELTVIPAAFQKAGPFLALADNGAPVLRVRSAFAKRVINAAYTELPDDGPHGKVAVGAAMRDKFYADAGTRGALGRLEKAYPKLGALPPSEPVTRAEAQAAVLRCGVDMRGKLPAALRPYPLTPKEGDVSGIRVNPKSDNGFPVGMKWEYPGAAEKCMGLAVTMRRGLEEAHRRGGWPGVVEWKRTMEREHPYLVALKGKAKADYYSADKLGNLQMRFYNALPRQVMLNMQVSTQVLELNAQHILNSSSHSGIGMSLTYGQADDLVDALDRMLRMEGRAYVHVGDDSWVVIKEASNRLRMFALDCSNFDLTQHGDVTKEVHVALRQELERIDAPSAALWYAFMRDRLVVVTNTLVRRWHHAGPSGMPLQSKVNDLLMDVMINRVLARYVDGLSEAELDALLQDVGDNMGFKVRLEQHWYGAAGSVRAALEQVSFLFIGYYFHTDEQTGKVHVHADVARTFAQVPYPNLKWTSTTQELALTEAMRLGSITMNLGLPTPALEQSFLAFRAHAQALVEAQLEKHPEAENDRLRWAVKESPWGPETAPSLRGLLAAMSRDPRKLWLDREPELPGASELLYGSWADMVEAEEREKAAGEQSVVDRPAAVTVRALRVPHRRVPTHPASAANDGRPPPTAVWGPDKPKRLVADTQGVGRSGGRRGRVDFVESEDSSESTDSDWGMDYADYEVDDE